MYLIESGRFRIAEHGLDVRPSQIVGELGMLSPGNRRTGSLACVEAGSARCLSYSEVKQLYYQNPEFGFYFLKLTSERLFQSAAEATGAQRTVPAGSDVL
jgi:CRP-like cAMP-binding protein